MNVKVNINGTLKKQNEFICFIFQVKQRADECILALDKLTEINSGISVQNVLETHFDWSTLKVSFWLPLAVTCMQDSCHACMQCVVANTIMEMCHKTQKVVVTRAWGKLASVTRLQEMQKSLWSLIKVWSKLKGNSCSLLALQCLKLKLNSSHLRGEQLMLIPGRAKCAGYWHMTEWYIH